MADIDDDSLSARVARIAGKRNHRDAGRRHLSVTASEAEQIAALLRFQSAMTPEMWNTVNLDGNRPMPDEIRTPSDAVAAALDTLRQELQQP